MVNEILLISVTILSLIDFQLIALQQERDSFIVASLTNLGKTICVRSNL